MPDTYVSLSTEILPQIRVYERHSTTALNAYVGPVLSRYLSKLSRDLDERGFKGTLHIMQSNGGVMSPAVAQRYASNTLLSGPAGGPQAGVFYGATHGFKNVITVDMGGTSFDIALVKDGTPSVTTDGMIGDHRVASPILDIHTIGAGGGSIAWIDSGGLLTVGPASAGAQPGPACYGRGGEQPTVTDADLLLGYLAEECGELTLDRNAATKAMDEHVAAPLQMSSVEAANGVYEIVNHNMAAALNVVSVQRGYDPREFVLVVAGGAGPIHAAPIARELEIPLILIPRESSVFCAAGMLISDLQHDYVRTYAQDLDNVVIDDVNRLFAEMSSLARQTLEAEGLTESDSTVSLSADLRYVGQFNEVEAAVAGEEGITADELQEIVERFHQRHDALYGYAMREMPVELINLRVTARGRTPKPDFQRGGSATGGVDAAKTGSRSAYFDGEFVDVSVYDGLALEPGHAIAGPAIVTQPTTTILVPPDFELRCDDYGNYLMHAKGADADALCAELRSST